MKVTKQLILVLIIFSVLTLPAYSLTIKIGSIAPARSPWDKALRELGREWTKITEGKVRLKIYPGGIAGNQDDVIRKMRMGILGGALMVNRGFTKLYRDVYALNIPFLITSEDELNYVLDKLKPVYEKAIEEKGFKVVILTRAGFFHFFTKEPVKYPEDLKKHKLSFTSNEPQLEQAWKKSGYHVVPNDLNDLMMALQSGMVTAFYLPPLVAGSGQYFPLAPYMSSQPIAPMVGGIILTKRIWEQIPEKYKKEMMNVCVGLDERLYKKTVKLEKEAVEEMTKHGLKIIDFPPGAMEKWREASDKGMNELIGKVFSKETYDLILHYLEEFRKKNDN
jgi:TRAP-type C4-dicarboxylate transport system substrate-binding protein